MSEQEEEHSEGSSAAVIDSDRPQGVPQTYVFTPPKPMTKKEKKKAEQEAKKAEELRKKLEKERIEREKREAEERVKREKIEAKEAAKQKIIDEKKRKEDEKKQKELEKKRLAEEKKHGRKKSVAGPPPHLSPSPSRDEKDKEKDEEKSKKRTSLPHHQQSTSLTDNSVTDRSDISAASHHMVSQSLNIPATTGGSFLSNPVAEANAKVLGGIASGTGPTADPSWKSRPTINYEQGDLHVRTRSEVKKKPSEPSIATLHKRREIIETDEKVTFRAQDDRELFDKMEQELEEMDDVPLEEEDLVKEQMIQRPDLINPSEPAEPLPEKNCLMSTKHLQEGQPSNNNNNNESKDDEETDNTEGDYDDDDEDDEASNVASMSDTDSTFSSLAKHTFNIQHTGVSAALNRFKKLCLHRTRRPKDFAQEMFQSSMALNEADKAYQGHVGTPQEHDSLVKLYECTMNFAEIITSSHKDLTSRSSQMLELVKLSKNLEYRVTEHLNDREKTERKTLQDIEDFRDSERTARGDSYNIYAERESLVTELIKNFDSVITDLKEQMEEIRQALVVLEAEKIVYQQHKNRINRANDALDKIGGERDDETARVESITNKALEHVSVSRSTLADVVQKGNDLLSHTADDFKKKNVTQQSQSYKNLARINATLEQAVQAAKRNLQRREDALQKAQQEYDDAVRDNDVVPDMTAVKHHREVAKKRLDELVAAKKHVTGILTTTYDYLKENDPEGFVHNKIDPQVAVKKESATDAKKAVDAFVASVEKQVEDLSFFLADAEYDEEMSQEDKDRPLDELLEKIQDVKNSQANVLQKPIKGIVPARLQKGIVENLGQVPESVWGTKKGNKLRLHITSLLNPQNVKAFNKNLPEPLEDSDDEEEEEQHAAPPPPKEKEKEVKRSTTPPPRGPVGDEKSARSHQDKIKAFQAK